MQGHGKSWSAEKLLDHEVIDSQGEKIGKLRASWVDEHGNPEFLGVKTGWLMGKIHVVPAELAEVSERSERIRLRASAEQVKNAPTADEEAELTDQLQQQTCQYYGTPRQQFPATGQSREEFYGQARQPGEKAVLTQEPTRPAEPQPAHPAAPAEHAEETRIPLREEHLHVEKRQAMVGGVRLRKIIRTETVQQPVELKHEEIVVEHVPAAEAGASPERPIEEEEIFIPLRGEVPVVAKTTEVREEVRVRKQEHTEQQTVSGQVRREDVEIERQEGQPESEQERRRRAA